MGFVVADKKAEALKIVEDEVEVLPTISKVEHETWFDGNIHHYKTLAAMVAATLKSTLDGHGISYVDIPFREKGKKSFLKKIEDKKKKKDYSPDDMTDLAGIRVITLIESDIQKVGDLIHQLFNVHKEDSVNKTESLGEDKVGYRSVHFVCDIGEAREDLPEWKFLKGRCFEIQVRTALMHAWAEIEHDRGYKLGGKLPSDLARRFSLLSGLLESADLEFNRLTVEIEEYAKNVEKDIHDDININLELSTISVKALINHIIPELKINVHDDDFLTLVIDTAIRFGINNINDLKELILKFKPFLSLDFINKIEEHSDIVFIALMYEDIYKLFNLLENNENFEFSSLPSWVVKILKHNYDLNELESFFKKHNVIIENT